MSGGRGRILSSAGGGHRAEGADGEKTPGWKDEAEKRRRRKRKRKKRRMRDVIAVNSDLY